MKDAFEGMEESMSPESIKRSDEIFEAEMKIIDNNGWISVKDRLPEETTFVIGYGGAAVAPMIFCNGDFGMWTADRIVFFGNVTHWHPLPPPPEPNYEGEKR